MRKARVAVLLLVAGALLLSLNRRYFRKSEIIVENNFSVLLSGIVVDVCGQSVAFPSLAPGQVASKHYFVRCEGSFNVRAFAGEKRMEAKNIGYVSGSMKGAVATIQVSEKGVIEINQTFGTGY